MKKIKFPKRTGVILTFSLAVMTFSACNSDDYSQQEHTDPTHVDHAPSDSELTRNVDTMMVDKTRVALDSADRTIPLNSDSMAKKAGDSAGKNHPEKEHKH